MAILKQILAYLIWIVLALLSGVGYMRIVLGAKGKPSTGFLHMFDLFYDLALIYIGLIIGGIVALLYILVDIFYLKKKLKNNRKATLIRFLIILGITVFVGLTHYILEKVIDII